MFGKSHGNILRIVNKKEVYLIVCNELRKVRLNNELLFIIGLYDNTKGQNTHKNLKDL